MSRRIQRRGVAAAALALTLVLGTPAHAANLSDWIHVPTLVHQAWQWVGTLLPGGAVARPEGQARSTHQKVKLGEDSNVDSGATLPRIEIDKGAGVDPNG